MAKTLAPQVPAISPDPLGLDEPGPAGEEEGLDLEAYLDLEESPEITRLLQDLRGESGAGPGLEGDPPAAGALARAAASAPAARPLDATPPGGAGETPRAAPVRGPAETGAPGSPRGAPAASPPLDLGAVACALGEVRVEGRQLVVACPACGGRPVIVVYASRFKCFGCEATGGEAALAALLTGWDDRRVAAWLAEAREARGEEEPAAGRRPWGLSLFGR